MTEGDGCPGYELPVVSQRRARLNTSPFETWICLAATLIGAVNLAWPFVIDNSNLNAVTPLWATYVLNGGYMLAAGAILAGLWRGDRVWESAGLWLLASQLAVGAMVIGYLRGVAGLTSIILYSCLTAASVQRAIVVRRYRHITVALGRDKR